MEGIPENSQATKKRKRGSKSVVWDHFSKSEFEDGGQRFKAGCNYCGKTYKTKLRHGTTTLHKHLLKCLECPVEVLENHTGIVGHENFDPKASRRALAKMIIVDELPFKFVEHQGFRDFMSVVQPKFKIMSRTTVAKDCLKVFVHERIKLKKMLSSISSRICLTMDSWTSIQNASYLCLTAHFIDENWQLHKRILNFCPISCHGGKDIGKLVETCLFDWGIEKVGTITVDNATANDSALSYLKRKKNTDFLFGGEFLHVRCSAHILNLIVKEGLVEVRESLARIRGAVKYIRSSPTRGKKFKLCVEKERITAKHTVC